MKNKFFAMIMIVRLPLIHFLLNPFHYFNQADPLLILVQSCSLILFQPGLSESYAMSNFYEYIVHANFPCNIYTLILAHV